jgi:hypothetical protein
MTRSALTDQSSLATAQAMRAILLANAKAASFAGRRLSSFTTHGYLSGRARALLMTESWPRAGNFRARGIVWRTPSVHLLQQVMAVHWHKARDFGGAEIPSAIGGSAESHRTSLRPPFIDPDLRSDMLFCDATMPLGSGARARFI